MGADVGDICDSELAGGIDIELPIQGIVRHDSRAAVVISPFLTGCIRRIHAAIFIFIAGVMPPMPMLGRSLLYVHSHFVAWY